MHLYSWKPDFTPDTVAVPHFKGTIPPPQPQISLKVILCCPRWAIRNQRWRTVKQIHAITINFIITWFCVFKADMHS